MEKCEDSDDSKPEIKATEADIDKDLVEKNDSICDNSVNLSQLTNDSKVSLASFESINDAILNKEATEEKIEEFLSQFANDSEISLTSFESIDDPIQNEEATDGNIGDFLDTIIDVFTVKKRKALIDTEPDEDLVSVEVSKRRIFNGVIFISAFQCIVCTILICQLSSRNQLESSPWYLADQPKSTTQYPRVTFLFQDGNINSFRMNGMYIVNHSWTFNLPSGKKMTKFFTFVDQGNIFVIYSDGNKDVIYISLNNDKVSHGKIQDSKLPSKDVPEVTARIGYHFWFIGRTYISNEGWEFIFMGKQSLATVPNGKTTIWNIRKQVYYPGPNLNKFLPSRSKFGNKLSLISLNQSHVLALYLSDKFYSIDDTRNETCLEGIIYSFESFVWTYPHTIEDCLFKIDIAPEDSFMPEDTIIKGAQYFEKSNQ